MASTEIDRAVTARAPAAHHHADGVHAHHAPHSHGGKPHLHVAPAVTGDRLAQFVPDLSVLRASVQFRLAVAVTVSTLIWLALHLATR